jgi:hypothetical protein
VRSLTPWFGTATLFLEVMRAGSSRWPYLDKLF